MGRAPCCDKENVKRGPWSHEEDAKLKDFINKYGTGGNWIALPHKAGLKRCGKSCRLRWLNYLRPNIKHGEFTDDEDKIICSLYANIGSRWSIIAGHLPGRTDNDIKNYWNTKLKKMLLAMFPSFHKKPSFFSSFHKKPSFFPSLPLQSPTPYTSNMLLTNNSSPFYTHTTPNFMNLSNNIITLAQDQINFTHDLSQHQPPQNSLITNNINNNGNSFYLGFQEDHQSMYNYPTSDVKEAMLMFGSGGQEGYHEVSTTGSSSEGGSCSSQMSYGNCSENHDKKQQHYDQIKQEDQFSLQGFGDQSQSFMINHMNYTDQKPKGYILNNVYESSLHGKLEEVKQLISNDDEYMTTHDHKEICYHY